LLQKYEDFRRKFDPEYARGGEGTGIKFQWPTPGNNAGGANQNIFQQNNEVNDDELYD
jgi:hypothetical protein